MDRLKQILPGISSLLAVGTVAGGFSILYLRPELKTETVALMMAVLSYYFGSSDGSRLKDNILAKLHEGKNEPDGPGA